MQRSGDLIFGVDAQKSRADFMRLIMMEIWLNSQHIKKKKKKIILY